MTEMSGPLKGVRVLELATIIAGPLAGCLLADFGADVVKVELPGRGDPQRGAPPLKDGESLWWRVTDRNKRSITIDLHKPEGQELIRQLVPHFDVVIENFRPGVLERWGIGWETLREINPRLIMLRITAFGQTGPYAGRPGFARGAEAFSGLAHITGFADGPPLHAGYPLADGMTGFLGAMSVSMALWERERTGVGQYVDLSLYESILRILEFLVIEYDQLGYVRGRSGNQSQYVAPANTYETKEGRWVSISTSTQSTYERVMRVIGRPDLIDNPETSTLPARLRNRDFLDQVVGDWVRQHTVAELDELLQDAEVGYSAVNSIEDLYHDPHVAARQNIVTLPDPVLGEVRMQGVVPRFSRTPGAVYRPAPLLGEHNEEIFHGLLGLSEDEVAALRDKGVVA